MPIYTFRNTETDETFTKQMKMDERETYLQENPHITQLLTSVAIGDSVRLGVRKTDDSFNDILKFTKRRNPHSTIETR